METPRYSDVLNHVLQSARMVLKHPDRVGINDTIFKLRKLSLKTFTTFSKCAHCNGNTLRFWKLKHVVQSARMLRKSSDRVVINMKIFKLLYLQWKLLGRAPIVDIVLKTPWDYDVLSHVLQGSRMLLKPPDRIVINEAIFELWKIPIESFNTCTNCGHCSWNTLRRWRSEPCAKKCKDAATDSWQVCFEKGNIQAAKNSNWNF